MSSPVRAPEIRLEKIRVTFGQTNAVDAVDLVLRPGERHAVVGENGAGKSTLMRVLFGLRAPTAGEIRLDGQPVRFRSPADAMRQGIGMVQQHFELIDSFTVAENILLGDERAAVAHGRFDRRRASALVADLARAQGLPIDPESRVADLTVAARQRVEILKALYRRARVLILDEPTAVLTPDEARELWQGVRRLSASGTTVVFVTHHLDDVMAHADTVTVLRLGRRVLTAPTSETNPTVLARAMVGDDTLLPSDATGEPSTAPTEPSAPILEIRHLTVGSDRGNDAVRDVSLIVHPGEIVGIAAVEGSGETELLEAILGLRGIASGQILFRGQDVAGLSVAERREAGMGFVPPDRHRQAIVPPLSCAENLILGQQRTRRFRGLASFLRAPEMAVFFHEQVKAFDVRGAAPHLALRHLSGGNQQKLVLARELSRQPALLIAAQPTRGLDFAATAFVRSTLVRERERGCAVLLQSVDPEELLSLSDRIVVLRAGRVSGMTARREATLERIGRWMTGAETDA
ncbi:MAG: ABC transporter ATP-binding protein [Capsulimonadales bacterium]|nr:ABC transporter ATP-binding protein [Capsulimonadales bacterium]